MFSADLFAQQAGDLDAVLVAAAGQVDHDAVILGELRGDLDHVSDSVGADRASWSVAAVYWARPVSFHCEWIGPTPG